MPTTAVWHLRSEAGVRAKIALVALAGALVVLLVVAAFIASFISPTASIATPVTHLSGGNLADLGVNAPVYFAQGDFWLVRTADDGVHAFHARDTRHWLVDGLITRCPVRWLPDFWYYDPAQARQTQGWFRADCSGSTFSRDGTRVFGPSPYNLSQYPVTVSPLGVITIVVAKNRLMKGEPGPGVRMH